MGCWFIAEPKGAKNTVISFPTLMTVSQDKQANTCSLLELSTGFLLSWSCSPVRAAQKCKMAKLRCPPLPTPEKAEGAQI